MEIILESQQYIFNVILYIIIFNTETYLERYKYFHRNIAKVNEKQIYIKENKLIDRYQLLIAQLNLMKFPTVIINHVSLILRILKSIFKFGFIDSYNILLDSETDSLNLLGGIYNIYNEITLCVLNTGAMAKRNELELYLLLEKIASIKEFKYYNNIFKLLQHDLKEPNERAKKYLNIIEYPNITKYHFYKHCDQIISVYAFCFDIQRSVINRNSLKTSLKDVEKKLLSILYILKAVVKADEDVYFVDIILYADQYLSYNLIEFPNDDTVREKLIRILYLITNLIDKFQVCSCKITQYRDTLYGRFKTNPKFLETLLDLNKNDLKEFITGKKKSKFDRKTTNSNLDKFVLFKQFISDMNKNNHLIQPIQLFWKGELKNINEISEDMSKNLFNFLSIPNYIAVVIKWTIMMFAYTILDIMNYLLVESGKKTDLLQTIELFKNQLSTQSWPKNSAVAFRTVIRGMRILAIPKRSFSSQIIEMRTILENDLKQYNNAVSLETRSRGNRPLNFKKLNKLCEIFNNILLVETNKKCQTRRVINPLVYTISYYFLSQPNTTVK